jgi:PAS domain S-box-containing protein
MPQAAVHNVFVVEPANPSARRIREVQFGAGVAPASPVAAHVANTPCASWIGQERRLAQIRALTEACRTLGLTPSMEEIYRIVMPSAAELLGAKQAVLMFPDELGLLHVRAAFGVDPGVLVHCNGAEDSVEARLQRAFGASCKEHILAVPLVVKNVTPGLLAVHLARAPTEADSLVLALLADQAAVALDQVGRTPRGQTEELLGLLVDALTEYVIIVLDVEGRVETWNHGAARVLGYTTAEALGRPFVQFYAPGQDGLAVTSLGFAEERGRHEGEATWICKDGRQMLASVLIVAFGEPDGRRRGFAVLARDITARRAAQQAQREAECERLRAESANRMKDEFLATVSHELRTPLTAILGRARILRDAKYDKDRVEKSVAIIERNARAQLRIIEDILDISRIVAGKVKIELQPVDPRGVIEAAVKTLEAAASAGGVTLQAELDPELGSVLGDGERLQQVLWNLLSNAIKFTPSGGHVEVSARRSGDALEIVVRDTGKGISPAFLPHVFERFRQDEAASTRAVRGLGLGLAIVGQIVEMHGGTVNADSRGHGLGATFTVHLPAVDTPPQPQITSSPEPTVALVGRRLLVVDDEPDTCDLLRTAFEARGARVETAESAREALAQLQTGGVDLLLSDISMPGEDGFWLIHQVRSSADPRLKQLPALALTAYARAEDRDRALGAGFHMYLSKPIHPDEVVKVAGDLMSRLVVSDDSPIADTHRTEKPGPTD